MAETKDSLVLTLEDGFTIRGEAAGRTRYAQGEVVINTCMSGYQEVLSDPSYAGQIVVMTYPLIGNTGVTAYFSESARPWVRALVTRQLSRTGDHWRATGLLSEGLDAFDIPILTDVDTRRLARHLRSTGALRAVVAPAGEAADASKVVRLEDQDLVAQVSRPFVDTDEILDEALVLPGMRRWPGMRVVLVDFGVKRNILRSLRGRGVTVEILPHDATAEMVLGRRPDAVVLSNGPGDPARLPGAVEMTRSLLGLVPVLGICLGHQLIAQAAGGRTARLRFGHHGGKHPVIELRNGRVSITSQNHEFQVLADSIPAESGFEVSHRSLHDGSVEGLTHRRWPVRSVQFHPEGSPGPQDNQHLFDEFLGLAAGETKSRLAALVQAPDSAAKPESVL